AEHRQDHRQGERRVLSKQEHQADRDDDRGTRRVHEPRAEEHADADPLQWELTTLSSGTEAAAAEDVAIADVNGDGWLDILAACELAHLVLFQNPGKDLRNTEWPRTIPPITQDRGSYIRAFFADFDKDGRPEVVAANKGEQNPDVQKTKIRHNLSIYLLPDNPLDGSLWREQVLGKVVIPINSMPFDLDGDGDLDVVAGSRGEQRILWFENLGNLKFQEHAINWTNPLPENVVTTGFNMDFADLNADGRIDIVMSAWPGYLLWAAQPASPEQTWQIHIIGDIVPDLLVSVRLGDIDGDGDLDAFSGAYSRGPRENDGDEVGPNDPMGRIVWFENQGDNNWARHDISRRKRGMYDKWLMRDLDKDGDPDFIGTRGNSAPYDGVIWLEQVRTDKPVKAFAQAREQDSQQMPLPSASQ
ncbi:MAG: VCBS repeat-containing protein, partial [Pseudomonadota bacterium]